MINPGILTYGLLGFLCSSLLQAKQSVYRKLQNHPSTRSVCQSKVDLSSRAQAENVCKLTTK